MTFHQELQVMALDWEETMRSEGNCVGGSYDPRFFSSIVEEQALAISICSSCPAQRECLYFATFTLERDGIWGGLTEHARESLVIQARNGTDSKGHATWGKQAWDNFVALAEDYITSPLRKYIPMKEVPAIHYVNPMRKRKSAALKSKT